MSEKQRDIIIGIDLAKPGSDTTGFICTRCKAVMFTADEADQHECDSADGKSTNPEDANLWCTTHQVPKTNAKCTYPNCDCNKGMNL